MLIFLTNRIILSEFYAGNIDIRLTINFDLSYNKL
jgi:hypothetical protein